MAIRESNSGTTEWVQFYQRNLSCQPTGSGGGGGGGGGSGSGGLVFGRTPPMIESTVVTTTTTSATSPAGAIAERAGPVSEGRVGKAARRRSRASRKTPTTVLNTDTTNFRALVQQFTGVPSGPFPAGYSHMADGAAGGGPPTLSFGISGGAAQMHQQPAVFPFGMHQQQHYPQFQQHHERQLFTLGESGGNRSTGPGSGGVYLRGFGGNAQRNSMDASEGLLLENIQLIPRPVASTSSSTTDGFLL